VDTAYQDYVARSISVRALTNSEPQGQLPQLWLGWPKGKAVDVHVAVGTWSHQAEATKASLRAVLDEQLGLLKSHSKVI